MNPFFRTHVRLCLWFRITCMTTWWRVGTITYTSVGTIAITFQSSHKNNSLFFNSRFKTYNIFKTKILQDMCIHGIEVPSQVSENVPESVDMPNGNSSGNANEYNELLYSHLVTQFLIISCWVQELNLECQIQISPLHQVFYHQNIILVSCPVNRVET